MSEEAYSLAAVLALLVAAVGLWSAIRRRQIMRKVLRSLDERQRAQLGMGAPNSSAGPGGEKGSAPSRTAPTIADALVRVIEELETARRLLSEVSAIGLWSPSDDSSDNRRRRQGLRETDWAVAGALRALTELGTDQSQVSDSLRNLESDLRALLRAIEPLPDRVDDTMGGSGALDAAIGNIPERVAELLKRASDLAAELNQSS